MRLVTLLALITPALAQAAPGYIPVQGLLTDSNGLSVDGSVDVSFTLFSNSGGTTSLWTDTMTVDIVDGRFATELGGNIALDLDMFRSYETVHLEIQVTGDSAMPLVPLDHVPYAAAARHAQDADLLDGVSLASIRSEIPLSSDIEAAARGVCFDSELELTNALNDNYLDSGYQPSWSTLSGIPSDLSDGDDVGLAAESDLTNLLDDNYLAIAYTPAWASLSGVPSGFLDGSDDGFSTESELTGLLDNNYLSTSYVPAWGAINGVPGELLDGDDGFTTEAQLTGLLDNNYLASSYVPTWGAINGVPGELLDGDDGFTTEAQLTTLLDNNYLAASYVPTWGAINGIPGDILDGDHGFTTEGQLTTLLNDNYVGASGGTAGNLTMTGSPSTTGDLSVGGVVHTQGLHQVGNAAPVPYTITNQRYVIDAGPSLVGRVVKIDATIMNDLCRDIDGCSFMVHMLNWDGLGNAAKRGANLTIAPDGRWRIDHDHTDVSSGRDGDGANDAEYAPWDCYFTERENLTNNSNGRADTSAGWGLLNVLGGGQSDANTTCRVVIED